MHRHPHAVAASLPLSSRVAVVTGASSGIGAATARLLAARGAKVALLARRASLLEQRVAEIVAAGGVAMAVAADVTDPPSVSAAAATIAAQFGVVNLLVNNAALMLAAPMTERRTEDWHQMISLNLGGALGATSVFLPFLLQAAADGCPADLVNVSSVAAQSIYPNFAVYSATRAATSHLSRHLRVELGALGVRVSVIEPGIVATGLQSHLAEQEASEGWEGTRERIEWLRPEDVAEVIAFTVGLPPHVNLQQLTIMPTRQAS